MPNAAHALNSIRKLTVWLAGAISSVVLIIHDGVILAAQRVRSWAINIDAGIQRVSIDSQSIFSAIILGVNVVGNKLRTHVLWIRRLLVEALHRHSKRVARVQLGRLHLFARGATGCRALVRYCSVAVASDLLIFVVGNSSAVPVFSVN
jgi:hypothetical protein